MASLPAHANLAYSRLWSQSAVDRGQAHVEPASFLRVFAGRRSRLCTADSAAYALDQQASQAAGGLAAVKLDGSATVMSRRRSPSSGEPARATPARRGRGLRRGAPDPAPSIRQASCARRAADRCRGCPEPVTFARERELLVAVNAAVTAFGQIHLRRRHADRPVVASRRAG